MVVVNTCLVQLSPIVVFDYTHPLTVQIEQASPEPLPWEPSSGRISSPQQLFFGGVTVVDGGIEPNPTYKVAIFNVLREILICEDINLNL